MWLIYSVLRGLVSYRFQRHGYKAVSLNVQVASIFIYGRRAERFWLGSFVEFLRGSSQSPWAATFVAGWTEARMHMNYPYLYLGTAYSTGTRFLDKCCTASEQEFHCVRVILFINNAMTDPFAINCNVHVRRKRTMVSCF